MYSRIRKKHKDISFGLTQNAATSPLTRSKNYSNVELLMNTPHDLIRKTWLIADTKKLPLLFFFHTSLDVCVFFFVLLAIPTNHARVKLIAGQTFAQVIHRFKGEEKKIKCANSLTPHNHLVFFNMQFFPFARKSSINSFFSPGNGTSVCDNF